MVHRYKAIKPGTSVTRRVRGYSIAETWPSPLNLTTRVTELDCLYIQVFPFRAVGSPHFFNTSCLYGALRWPEEMIWVPQRNEPAIDCSTMTIEKKNVTLINIVFLIIKDFSSN